MSNFQERRVRANGIEIHYVEGGEGVPLVLLHGGVVSTSPVWRGHPLGYVSGMGALAEHFRVIAPDTRGCGRTAHAGGGTVTFDLLADDVAALVGALGLDRPAICGFSEGGLTATLVGIRHPGVARAIVNDAGYDMLNPAAPAFAMLRQMFGGSPQASGVDPVAAERAFGASPEMKATFEMLKADQDAGQGTGHWKRYLELAFHRLTTPLEYSFADLGRISAPTMVLVGDRDHFCSVEEGVTTYRALKDGELAVLPNVGHVIPPSAIQATIEFLRRRAAAG